MQTLSKKINVVNPQAAWFPSKGTGGMGVDNQTRATVRRAASYTTWFMKCATNRSVSTSRHTSMLGRSFEEAARPS